MPLRHPKPGDVKAGDDARLQSAVGACLQVLEQDFRVQAFYEDIWIPGRDLARLERRFAIWQGTSQAEVAADALRRALFSGPTDQEVAALSQVLTEMGVPWTWPANSLLTLSFPALYFNAHRAPGSNTLAIEIGPTEMTVPVAPGRGPRDQGATIRRHVEWWYRYRIKVPKDSLAEIEAEELARTGQTTVSRRHSTVVHAIQQVDALLERWQSSK